eukprot:478937-Hanusia_phi.AAC.1
MAAADRRYELSVSVTRESGQLFSRSLLVSAQSPHLLSRDLIADSTGRHRVHVSLKEEGAEEVEEEQVAGPARDCQCLTSSAAVFLRGESPTSDRAKHVCRRSSEVGARAGAQTTDRPPRLLLHKFPFTSTSLIVIVPTSLDGDDGSQGGGGDDVAEQQGGEEIRSESNGRRRRSMGREMRWDVLFLM